MAAPLLLLLILQIYDKDICVDVKMEFCIKKHPLLEQKACEGTFYFLISRFKSRLPHTSKSLKHQNLLSHQKLCTKFGHVTI